MRHRTESTVTVSVRIKSMECGSGPEWRIPFQNDKDSVSPSGNCLIKNLVTEKDRPETTETTGSESSGSDSNDDALIEVRNPNHTKSSLDQCKDIGLTRKDRIKQEKRENYMKKHLEGKTPEAQSDMARLEKIRSEREMAANKRKIYEDSKKK
ncbi:hypothetical protein A3Q56_03496 [Intoshia linei]|uniref:Casein kinase substrate phosphoprotein PP28 domain-containing protein n=1 Tax=Intoshia linei TaxID=1819745 RepID=A0A177B3M1_9BILA|nr:hypothetical protein A3Q56_03496 [Intoshia linei]